MRKWIILWLLIMFASVAHAEYVDLTPAQIVTDILGLVFNATGAVAALWVILNVNIFPIRELLIVLFFLLVGNFMGALGTIFNFPVLAQLNGFIVVLFIVGTWCFFWFVGGD